MGFAECLELLFMDPETEGIVVIGEVGGAEEQETARYVLEKGLKKPAVGLIVGRAAPVQRLMGHAGALIIEPCNDADCKIRSLHDGGIVIAPSANLVGATMYETLARCAA